MIADPPIQVATPPIPQPSRGAARAVFLKDWREQRWRFALGALVLAGTLAALLRAQVIPYGESALLVYWIVGVVMSVFLAMSPVAAEKADGTWGFLLAQPAGRAQILLAKWGVVIVQLVGMMLIATVAGLLAMWSRGFAGVPSISLPLQRADQQTAAEAFMTWVVHHPAVWIFIVAACATVALACWLTPLFFILTRARNEFAAALGGVLLTIVLHAWLLVGVTVPTNTWFSPAAQAAGRILGYLNPMMLLVLVFRADIRVWLPVAMVGHLALWVVLPVYVVHRLGARPTRH